MSIRKAEVAGQGGQGRPKSSPDLFTGFGACLLNESCSQPCYMLSDFPC